MWKFIDSLIDLHILKRHYINSFISQIYFYKYPIITLKIKQGVKICAKEKSLLFMDMQHQQVIQVYNDDNELIQLQSDGAKDQLQDKKAQLESLLFGKIKQFWLQKVQVGKKLNKIEESQQQESNEFKRVLDLGLIVHEYLGQQTEFSRLYAQQIHGDYSQFRSGRQAKIFKRKAKLMLERYLYKSDEANTYLYFPFDWVKQRLPSYPHLISNPICIKQIQTKLMFNQYNSFELFLSDMNRMFVDWLMFTHGNKEMTHLFLRLRNSWEMVKFQVLQMKNFALQPFINPKEEFVPEMLDIDHEIGILRERVSIDKNVSEYLDYDPEYLTHNRSKDNSSLSNQEEKRKKHNETKKKSPNTKDKSKTKKVFESCQSYIKTIGKQRILELKKIISKCIANEMAQRNLDSRKLLKYIKDKRTLNPNFIGSQNQINLQSLNYEEFIELEETTKKYMNIN